MKKIALRREEISGRRITHMPEWIGPASPRGEYWHIPRSAQNIDGRIRVDTWCGQSFDVNTRPLSDRRPEEFACGTCIGRATGAVRDDGTIFSPRDDFSLPKWCPGESDGWHCIACGRKSRASSWFGGSGIASHRPDPLLAERCQPCPRHGWRWMQSRNGQLICFRHDGPNSNCEWNGGPYT